MNFNNITVISVVSLFTVSCAATSQLPRSTSEETERIAPVHVKTEEIKLDSVSNDTTKTWNDIVAEAEETKEYENLDDLFNEYNVNAASSGAFTEAESQHVKSSTYDPFGGKSYIHIDLDAMKDKFCFPIKNGKLISNYGIRSRRMHTGIDIKAQRGEDVYAAFDGVVRMSKPYSGYGNVIVIRHYNGLETVYSHNARNLVSADDVVSAGDVIAKAGRTGRATTEHVHFEVRVAGQHINPNNLVDVENHTLKSGSLYISRKGSKIVASNNRNGVVTSENTSDNVVKTEEKPAVVVAEAAEKLQSKPESAPAQDKSSSDAVYHTIASGDTLGALARKYGTTINNICELNNIKPTTVLQLKQRLRVK